MHKCPHGTAKLQRKTSPCIYLPPPPSKEERVARAGNSPYGQRSCRLSSYHVLLQHLEQQRPLPRLQHLYPEKALTYAITSSTVTIANIVITSSNNDYLACSICPAGKSTHHLQHHYHHHYNSHYHHLQQQRPLPRLAPSPRENAGVHPLRSYHHHHHHLEQQRQHPLSPAASFCRSWTEVSSESIDTRWDHPTASISATNLE